MQRKLQAVLDAEENAANRTAEANPEEQRRQREMRLRMDIDDSDIVVAGANPTRISRKQVIYLSFFPFVILSVVQIGRQTFLWPFGLVLVTRLLWQRNVLSIGWIDIFILFFFIFEGVMLHVIMGRMMMMMSFV